MINFSSYASSSNIQIHNLDKTLMLIAEQLQFTNQEKSSRFVDLLKFFLSF